MPTGHPCGRAQGRAVGTSSALSACPGCLRKGASAVVAPRVLVDATDVPADRGALVRYVDGLIGALDAAGADLAVVCQRADEEPYGQVAPSGWVVTGPAARSHRAARLAWEQSGLPLVSQQVEADVMPGPDYV